MCKLFIEANTELWKPSTRSIRIQGMVTSIRLEFSFWMVLEEIAARDSLTIPEMLNRLYQEALDAGHDISNFTSFLRVCAMRFISPATGRRYPDRQGRFDRLTRRRNHSWPRKSKEQTSICCFNIAKK